MASHRLNSASSRSHCILTLTVTQVDFNTPDNVITSKLQLVDLAGSERQSHFTPTDIARQDTSHAQKDLRHAGPSMKEAIDINKSLFTLRQVITALAQKKK